MSTPLTELPPIDPLTAHLLPFLIPARVMAANDVICQQIAARESAARAGERARITAAVEVVLAAGPDSWSGYESRDSGWVFDAGLVLDFVADLRAALATSTDGGAG